MAIAESSGTELNLRLVKGESPSDEHGLESVVLARCFVVDEIPARGDWRENEELVERISVGVLVCCLEAMVSDGCQVRDLHGEPSEGTSLESLRVVHPHIAWDAFPHLYVDRWLARNDAERVRGEGDYVEIEVSNPGDYRSIVEIWLDRPHPATFRRDCGPGPFGKSGL